MNTEFINITGAVNVTVEGPLSPYIYTELLEFTDEKTLVLNLGLMSQNNGGGDELVTITFDTTVAKSTFGATLLTEKVEGNLYKIPIVPDVVATIGSGVNTAMSTTMVALITSNIMMGGSSELMWGFMNTIQILYFFPLLNLYFPDNLSSILTHFSSSKLQIPIPGVESFKEKVKSNFNLEEGLDMPALNERYESIEYESTSILINADEITTVMTQGMVVCVIVYGLRAIFFTLQSDIAGVYQEELEKMDKNKKREETKQNDHDQSEIASNIGEEAKTQNNKKAKLRKWFKKKIQGMSHEYKYNFFLRVGIELFLEAFLLSLLNVYHCKYDNGLQLFSLVVASALMIILISF